MDGCLSCTGPTDCNGCSIDLFLTGPDEYGKCFCMDGYYMESVDICK